MGRERIEVRTAKPADLAAIIGIYNHAVEHLTATLDMEPVTAESPPTWFRRLGADDPLLVAEVGGAVGGYAYYTTYRPKPGYDGTREIAVYIDPAHHRQGLGTTLYGALIERARREGVHALIAVVVEGNDGSVAMHRKLGFEPVGQLREVGRKFGRWLDAFFLQKIL